MKKLLAFAAALSVASSANFVLPTAASADPGNGNVSVAHACQALAAGFGMSVGNCIGLVNSGGDLSTTNANTICHLWEGPAAATFGFPAYPFTTFGACTSTVNALF
jgi:hypothetical protein